MRSQHYRKSFLGLMDNMMNDNKNKSKLVPANVLSNITTTTYEKVLNCLKELKEFFIPHNDNKPGRKSVGINQMNCDLRSKFDNTCNLENKDLEDNNQNCKNTNDASPDSVFNKDNIDNRLQINEEDREYHVNNIDFVIDAIQSQNLYDYNNNYRGDSIEGDGDLSSLLGYLNSYSNQTVKKHKKNHRFTTTKQIDSQKIKKFAKISTIIEEEDEEIHNFNIKPRHHSLSSQQIFKNSNQFFRFNRNSFDDKITPKNDDNCLLVLKKNKSSIIDDKCIFTDNLKKNQDDTVVNPNKKISSIFKFDEESNTKTNFLTNEKNGNPENTPTKNLQNNLNTCMNSNLKLLTSISDNIKNDSFDIEIDDPYEILEKNFNIFELEEKIGQLNVLPTVVKVAFKYIDVYLEPSFEPFNTSDLNVINIDSVQNVIDFDKLEPFSVLVREKYNKNPYHNSNHGTDVFHSMYQIFKNSPIITWAKLNSIDVVSCLIAALVHDIGHPGFNNNFMINSKTDMAMLYNDRHVLENFHAAEGFRIISNSKTNIFNKLDDDRLKYLRKRYIQLIISTDPVLHSRIVCLIKNKLTSNEVDNGENVNYMVNDSRLYDDQQEILDFLMSFCDTSHSCRKFEITFNWSSRLMEEFWHQGDVEKELKLPVSFLCDRVDAFVGKGQIGFIQAIIVPSVTSLVTMCPSLKYLMETQIH